MYYDGFAEQLKGKKVLELGCGNCHNAAVMAALGAQVYANDISSRIGDIIHKLNTEADFEHPITYINGDFLKTEFKDQDFDIVVGKAFVHHLTHEQELQFLNKIQACLKVEGMVRFVEPAVNNRFVDWMRWMVPVKGRPSSLQTKKFEQWKINDPHPERDNSRRHYKKVGQQFFKEVDIISVGALERFHRLFPGAKWNRKFRTKAYKAELLLPKYFRDELARTQTIIYKFPKK